MTLNLSFEEPPAPTRQGRPASNDTLRVRDALVASPNQWIRVADGLKQRTAYDRVERMRKGKGVWSGLKVEARAVDQGDQGWSYYARLVGE